ncbi:MAG: hypothetical protein WBM68_02195 [Woeseia sp.]
MHESRDLITASIKRALDEANTEIPCPCRALTMAEPLTVQRDTDRFSRSGIFRYMLSCWRQMQMSVSFSLLSLTRELASPPLQTRIWPLGQLWLLRVSCAPLLVAQAVSPALATSSRTALIKNPERMVIS